MERIIVFLPVVSPMLFSILLMLFWKKQKVQRVINLISTAILTGIGGILLYKTMTTGIVAGQAGSWVAPFGITMAADPLSAVLVLLIGFSGFTIGLYSIGFNDRQREKFALYPLLNVIYMGISGAVMTGDIFNLYVWFEVILISSFVLLTLGGTKQQLEGGLKYVTINLLASVIFLAAVGILYGVAGTLNMADLARRVPVHENQVMLMIISGLFLISFGIKSAMFPLYFWLPEAYHTPPVNISAVFAGLLTKVGVYAMLRVFLTIFPSNMPVFQDIFLVIAGCTLITGISGAIIHQDIRKVIGFLIVTTIGFMIMGIGFGSRLAIAGVIFYMISDIIIKTNLYLISGMIKKTGGSFRFFENGGLMNSYPVLAVIFFITMFSLAGIPPLSGFWSKLMLVQSGLELSSYTLIGIALLTSLLTVYVAGKNWAEFFWKESPVYHLPGEQIKSKLFLGNNVYMTMATLLLTVAVLFIGLFPDFIFSITDKAAYYLLTPEEYIKTVLSE